MKCEAKHYLSGNECVFLDALNESCESYKQVTGISEVKIHCSKCKEDFFFPLETDYPEQICQKVREEQGFQEECLSYEQHRTETKVFYQCSKCKFAYYVDLEDNYRCKPSLVVDNCQEYEVNIDQCKM